MESQKRQCFVSSRLVKDLGLLGLDSCATMSTLVVDSDVRMEPEQSLGHMNDSIEILGSLSRSTMAWTIFCGDPEPLIAQNPMWSEKVHGEVARRYDFLTSRISQRIK